MSTEKTKSISSPHEPFQSIYDNAIERSLKYSSLMGMALGTLKAISIISDEPEIKALAKEKYDEIEKELKEMFK